MRIIDIINSVFIVILLSTVFKLDVRDAAKKHVIILENSTGSATGFYVMYKGKSHLITNKHVCKGLSGFDTADGYSKVISVYSEHDLCLLESHRIGGLIISDSELKGLDKVHVIGHPLGLPLTYFMGYFIYRLESMNSYIVSVPVFPGASGSPLLNDSGEVIGVIYATNRRTMHHGYAVPKDVLLDFLDDISKY